VSSLNAQEWECTSIFIENAVFGKSIGRNGLELEVLEGMSESHELLGGEIRK
jgi:hypothetical protein